MNSHSIKLYNEGDLTFLFDNFSLTLYFDWDVFDERLLKCMYEDNDLLL